MHCTVNNTLHFLLQRAGIDTGHIKKCLQVFCFLK